MTTTVLLPTQFRAEAIFPVIGKSLGILRDVPEEVIFDFRHLRFVRPSGVVFLSNLTRYLSRKGCRVKYQGVNGRRECIKFLDDSLFFEQHTGKKIIGTSSPRATTKPLIEIKHTESHAWIGFELLPWLSNASGVPIEELAEFRTCISELFNNIDDHTEFDVGCVFAQWFPKEKALEIAVADFGAGIPTTVRRVEQIDDDANAILRAFDDGFSAQSIPTNRGAGLHYLRQNVLSNLGGRLAVHSGEGSVRFHKSGNSIQTVPYTEGGYCPGTLIELEIQTDRIDFEPYESKGEFVW